MYDASNVNNTCIIRDTFKFVPKRLLVVGHKKEDIRVEMNFDHLNKLLDDYYTIIFKAMCVHEVHAGEFVVEVGNPVVAIQRSSDPN
jgi:hypothetical protein